MSSDENQVPKATKDKAAEYLRKPEPSLLRPRAVVVDAFEQNPLIKEENLYAAPRERVREAIRRIVEDEEPLAQVAKEMNLAPASVQRWKKEYYQMLSQEEASNAAQADTLAVGEGNFPAVQTSEGWRELNDQASVEDHRLFAADRRKFTENWDRLLEQTHATESDFRQDPWDVWLQNSDWTSWLFNDDGKFERSSLLGFLFLVLGVLAAYLMLMVDNKPAEAASTEPELKPAQVLLLRDEHNLEASYDVVKSFLRQDTWIERLQYVRDRDRVAPLIKQYYTINPDRAYDEVIPYAGMLGTEQISVAAEITGLNKEIHYFNVVPPAPGAKEQRHLIDWESSTLFQRPNFTGFLKDRPKTPRQLWVKVETEDYYNHQFSDKNVYTCYRLTFPGLTESCFGYVKNDSPAGVELKILTLRDDSPGVILEARYPDKVLDPLMTEITGLVSKQWIPEQD